MRELPKIHTVYIAAASFLTVLYVYVLLRVSNRWVYVLCVGSLKFVHFGGTVIDTIGYAITVGVNQCNAVSADVVSVRTGRCIRWCARWCL